MARRHPGSGLLLIIYLGFISLGLPDGTLGVAWPAIAADLHLPIGLAGTVTLVVTLLSAASGFASGRIIARFRTGPVVLISCLLTSAALLMISQAPAFVWLLAAAIPLGLGAGAVDAGLNGFVAHHYSGRHMNWLHACWGVGATCGPLVMGRALEQAHGWRTGYLTLGLAQLALAIAFIVSLGRWHLVPERHDDPAQPAAGTPALSANSFPGWLSPALFALYVALEGATGLWAASILTLSRGFTPEVAAWCTAGYYASITVGRILVGLAVDRVGNRLLITLGLCIALAGAAGFAFATAQLPSAVSLALMGFGFAPVYPGLMHEVPRRFAPHASQTVIGRQSGAAYLGMALLPAALGWLAGRSLDTIPFVVGGAGVLMLLGVRLLDRLTPLR